MKGDCKRLRYVPSPQQARQEQKEIFDPEMGLHTYDGFDIDETSLHYCDYDESLIEYKTVNLFPIVEKFLFSPVQTCTTGLELLCVTHVGETITGEESGSVEIWVRKMGILSSRVSEVWPL